MTAGACFNDRANRATDRTDIADRLPAHIPVGQYLADIVMDRKTRLDPVFDPVDGAIYWLIGRDAIRQPMNWKAYTFHMLATNLFMVLLIYLILVFQDYLPLNPLKLAGMEPVLAFNTAISFITNTDWHRGLVWTRTSVQRMRPCKSFASRERAESQSRKSTGCCSITSPAAASGFSASRVSMCWP